MLNINAIASPLTLNPSLPPSRGTRDEAASSAAQSEAQQLELLREVEKLSKRDREVRAHEQAHAAVGGQYAGSPRYTYERGPDGRRYAVSGEVPIDISPIPGDPRATIAKMEQVVAAALAPIQPSSQDRAVAAEARRLAAEARVELNSQRSETTGSRNGERTEDSDDETSQDESAEDNTNAAPNTPRKTLQMALDAYRANTEAALPGTASILLARA